MASPRAEVQGGLRLDRVLTSQPELGPSIPDGGYGWVVLVTTLFLQVVLPSVLSAYGVFMLFVRVEQGAPDDQEPRAWDTRLLAAPVLFSAAWSLGAPGLRALARAAARPRLTAAAGVALACAGLLCQWLALAHRAASAWAPGAAGALSGLGACLACQQGELLVAQHFRRRLPLARGLRGVAHQLGLVVTPAALGHVIVRHGLLRALLLYQAAALQLLVLALAFRSPKQPQPRRYRQLVEDDTEMSSRAAAVAAAAAPVEDEFARDLAGGPVPAPAPAPIYQPAGDPAVRSPLAFLRRAAFYEACLSCGGARLSALVFWALFPGLLYARAAHLQLGRTCALVGGAALGGVAASSALAATPALAPRRRRAALAAAALAAGAALLAVGEGGGEGWALPLGALLLTAALAVQDALQDAAARALLGPDWARAAAARGALVSLLLLLLLMMLVHDASYTSCFRSAALLQFVTAGVFLAGQLSNMMRKWFQNANSRH